ncbi:MAG TPA: Na+/H+ antiporter [Pseudomonadota bacterium]|nr:Na+/H+ antiporter [Pseudomonadota bacterium]
MPIHLILVFILLTVAVVAILANRTRIPAAILLVLMGLVLSVTPGLPPVELAPELVLLLVVPPLIYSAGVAMSWREFRYNIRSITLLAFGGVVFTTIAVAAVVHFLLGWDWSVGFVLGAIISPPDEVAPLAIARRLGLPRRTMVVLQGEGLANDATALILYRFAVAAVATGTFSFGSAFLVFIAIIIGEIAFGLAVGYASLRLRRWASDPRVEIILSLLTPFAAYLPPAALGGSGVLATVVCGLYISWNGPLLIPSHTRLQGIFFWDLFIFVLEGALFLLTGLQARPLLERGSQVTGSEFVVAALVTTVAVIAARFLWVFPSLYLPRLLIPAIRRTDPYPIWQRPFLVAFFGVRGIVSLAAALALPFTVASGAPFPYRDLILLLTFWVILVTLVGQGLLVPPLMRWLGLEEIAAAEQEEEQAAEVAARRKAIDAAMARLEELASERGLPAPVVENMRSHLMARLKRAEAVEADGEAHAHIRLRDQIERLLIDAERRHIFGQLERGELIDEARRHIERELDLREAELLRNIPGAINFED